MVNKCELIKIIERVAPPDTAEPWDLSGCIVEYTDKEIKKVMLALTVTKEVLKQAQVSGCDMIISHHPLFTVPLEFNQGIEIYCAHTNLDKAACGTTQRLIKTLEFENSDAYGHDFLRFVDCEIKFDELIERLKKVSTNIRLTNPLGLTNLKRIAFCAGSGTEFWHDAKELGAEVLVTGDLKFHTALDSEISIIDIGHFESEILVLDELARLLGDKVEVIKAYETSPIKQINS